MNCNPRFHVLIVFEITDNVLKITGIFEQFVKYRIRYFTHIISKHHKRFVMFFHLQTASKLL